MSLMQFSFYRGEGSRGGGGGGDVRRVVFREEREEERYVIEALHFRTKFQYLLTC